MARPAIAVGTSPALLEAFNDIGVSEFLGVQRLTVSLYATWINRINPPARIAVAMLLAVALIVFERQARSRQHLLGDAGRARPMQPVRVHGLWSVLARVICAIPVGLGFLAPAGHLGP